MSNKPEGQRLIEAFFTALEQKDLARCATILGQLETLAQEQPSFAPWCLYFGGILANERDRDWAQAERAFKQVLSTDLDPALHSRVLLALGRTYDYQGRWAEAITVYERALPIFETLNQPVNRAGALKNIAITCEKGYVQGDLGPQALQRAADSCQQALDLLPASSASASWMEATIRHTLGLVYKHLGRWQDAINCYQRSLALHDQSNYRFGVGVAHGNLGEIFQLQGPEHWPAALAAYRQALAIFRDFGDRYEETEVLANLASLYHDMGDLAAALDHYGQAIDTIEILRAGVTSEPSRAGFFATVTHTYANAVLLCLEMGDRERAFDLVELARSRAFLDMLAAGSSELPDQMEARTITLAEVQASLPPDALLIEYFTSGLVEARDGRARHSVHRFPSARTLIFAVTRDAVQVHDTGLAPNELLPRQLDSVVERHFLKPDIRRALYDRLIAPVAGLLRGRRRVYLIPHGPLHYIPFQALIAPDGETLLRADGPPLVYAPSASILFRSSTEETIDASLPCLALGYNDQGATRLRFAEEEALRIGRRTAGQILVGPTPKKGVLVDQARNFRMLHFSCHGAFDPETPLASALHLGPEETLTAEEVLQHLRLRCELVTLSACESGLSRVRRGDELVGFLRAFMHAGAASMLTTLWRVDERSTLILMERFYQQVQAGQAFPEALKQAQLYLKHLTRKEARDVLVRILTDKILNSVSRASDGPSDPPLDSASQTAGATIKGLTAREAQDSRERSSTEKDDDLVFADPFYWAAFVLSGIAGSE